MHINFSGLSRKKLYGRLFRKPLDLIPKNTIVKILQGSLKGKKWIVGASTHGCWLGSYEFENQQLFIEKIKEGSIIYDIGANVGFYSLLFSVITGEKGFVYAFEPVPSNILLLKRHLDLKKLRNVKVIESAIGNKKGKTLFKLGDNNSTGRIDKQGEIEVDAISLDTFIKNNPGPDFIKIDIEGNEYDALLGAEKLIKKHNPFIFLSTHSRHIKDLCISYLSNLGYNSELQINSDDLFLKFTNENINYR